MMMTRAKWLLVALGVIGAGMNAWGLRASFLVWIVANGGMVGWNARAGRWPDVVLFSIYLITAVIGWWRWAGGVS